MLMGGALCLWKIEVKKHFLSQKTDSELVFISKKDQIKLLDNGSEIEMNGERYDVVKTTSEAYLCWHDAKETHLVKNLFQSLVSKESKKSNTDFSILKNLIKIYFVENQYIISVKTFLVKIKTLSNLSFFDYYFPIFFIPPKF